MLAQAITTARAADVKGQVLCRADSAYYCYPFVGTALRHGTWFSVTTRMNPQVKAAIAGIDPDAWHSIEYPTAVYDDLEDRWVSDAEVAELPFVAFTGRRKAEHSPAGWSSAASSACSHWPATAPNKASCSPPTATTGSSPKAP